MRRHWKSGPPSSPPATLVTRPCCPNFSTRSRPISRSPASRPPLTVCMQTVAGQRTAPSTPASAMTPSPPAVLRLPPPKPRRDQDALCQTARPASHGTGLRPSGRGVPSSCCRPERLHRSRHAHYRSRGISLPADRGTLTVRPFVQQSHADIQERGHPASRWLKPPKADWCG